MRCLRTADELAPRARSTLPPSSTTRPHRSTVTLSLSLCDSVVDAGGWSQSGLLHSLSPLAAVRTRTRRPRTEASATGRTRTSRATLNDCCLHHSAAAEQPFSQSETTAECASCETAVQIQSTTPDTYDYVKTIKIMILELLVRTRSRYSLEGARRHPPTNSSSAAVPARQPDSAQTRSSVNISR